MISKVLDDPTRIRPLRGMLLVRKYQKPDTYGSLVIPDHLRPDYSGKLWEVVRSSPEAEEEVGARLPEGSILEIQISGPGDPGAAHTGFEDAAGRALFVLDPEKILGVILPTWEKK